MGGSTATPDQDNVDEIGAALGVSREEDEELTTSEEILRARDRRYICTPARDEHQRDRMRVFLQNECRHIGAMAAGAVEGDLAWIMEQGERIVSQELYPEADVIALFAGGSPALRVSVPLAVPVRDTGSVSDTARLRPLVAALAATPRPLVVFIGGERARIIALDDAGGTEEMLLAAVRKDAMLMQPARGPRIGWPGSRPEFKKS